MKLDLKKNTWKRETRENKGYAIVFLIMKLLDLKKKLTRKREIDCYKLSADLHRHRVACVESTHSR